jgi:putative membrane protein
MLYASLAICGRVLRADDRACGRLRWAVTAAVVLTAWDVAMDPAMVRTAHWTWRLPPPEGRPLLHRLLVGDAFYGMPLSNWLGWLLTGTVVARAMLAIVPPSAWARHVAPTRVPLVLYAVNGVLPVVICARHGMGWAAGIGAAAMLVPLALAVRGRPAAARAAGGPGAPPRPQHAAGRDEAPTHSDAPGRMPTHGTRRPAAAP